MIKYKNNKLSQITNKKKYKKLGHDTYDEQLESIIIKNLCFKYFNLTFFSPFKTEFKWCTIIVFTILLNNKNILLSITTKTFVIIYLKYNHIIILD